MKRSDLHALLVVPANNTTMKSEITMLCPEFKRLSVAGVPRPPRTLLVEDLPAYRESTLKTVEVFAAERPHIVIYGCTAAGFLAGPEGNTRMVDDLRRQTGAKTVSTAEAMVDALAHSKARTISVVTPYLDPVNEGLCQYLASSGIRVAALNSFRCATVDALGGVTREQVFEKALETMTPGSEGLFIACSQLPTLGILDRLRGRFNRPVWSSIQATAWAALNALDRPSDRLDGSTQKAASPDRGAADP